MITRFKEEEGEKQEEEEVEEEEETTEAATLLSLRMKLVQRLTQQEQALHPPEIRSVGWGLSETQTAVRLTH
jgi:hypothetical protein